MNSTILGDNEEPTLGTYDDTYLVSLEGFTDGTADVKLDGLFMVARLVLLN